MLTEEQKILWMQYLVKENHFPPRVDYMELHFKTDEEKLALLEKDILAIKEKQLLEAREYERKIPILEAEIAALK